MLHFGQALHALSGYDEVRDTWLVHTQAALAMCSRKELAVLNSSGNGKLPGLINLQSCNPATTEISIVVKLHYIEKLTEVL